MRTVVFAADKPPFEPRGYAPVYDRGVGHQRCPSCSGKHWLIGRHYAECANERCGYAMPLAQPGAEFMEPLLDD